MTFTTNHSSTLLSPSEQQKLIEKLQVFTIQGTDQHGRPLLCIIGKYFPARLLSVGACVKFLEDKVYPNLGDKPFSLLYVHTGVNRRENFPGISALRSLYDAIPSKVRENLQTVYFLHPSIQSRLFLATFGRLILGGGFYGKLRYVQRLDLLWNEVRRKELDIPEFVYDKDKEMDSRPCMMDFGFESDHPRFFHSAALFDEAVPLYSDNAVPLYCTRCLA